MKTQEYSVPEISERFKEKMPSSLRMAMLEYDKRKDKDVQSINLAIGNVPLPMHPAMIERFRNLNKGFPDNSVMYTSSGGTDEVKQSFRNIIASSGFDSDKLSVLTTDGGSMAMELAIVGMCGTSGSTHKPLMLIDPAYTNYKEFASRLGRSTVSVQRMLQENGEFTLPDMGEIEHSIKRYKPGGMVVIPYDNPTGQFFDMDRMIELAQLCVDNNIWMLSDEAYRELHYTGGKVSSIWGITDKDIRGIEGRRLSIESASKVWNACGIRIGALVSDNELFVQKALAEYTTNLCPNALGQYIFGALAQVNHKELQQWFGKQRAYYKPLIRGFISDLKKEMPGIIVSRPDAAIYSVIDFRNVAKDFDAGEFAMYCAKEGEVDVNGSKYTFLAAPMSGFYTDADAGRTQVRVAYVKTPEEMKEAAYVLGQLFKQFNPGR